jgi:hypothetical protein
MDDASLTTCPIVSARRYVTKAPEGWRTPKPGGVADVLANREASWIAVVLCRFGVWAIA